MTLLPLTLLPLEACLSEASCFPLGRILVLHSVPTKAPPTLSNGHTGLF